MCCPRLGPLGGGAGRVRPGGGGGRLRADHHPDVRGPGRLPAGRRVHRRGPQGDVRLRGQGRPPRRPAPRGHRVGGPGLHPAPAHRRRGRSWYAGSNFRYERPQAGRYREFHQVGIEAFGSADPDLDVEVIALGWEFYAALGLRRVELLLNSLGDARLPPGVPGAAPRLPASARRDELCDEHQDRLEENPLRVLDCKKPGCRAVIAGRAPPARPPLRRLPGPLRPGPGRPRRARHRLPDRHRRWCAGSTTTPAPRSSTSAVALESAQNARRRRGPLRRGWSRRWAARPRRGSASPSGSSASCWPATPRGCRAASGRAGPGRVRGRLRRGRRGPGPDRRSLRAAGLRVDRAFDGRSAKAQFKAADRSGARSPWSSAPDEAAAGTVGIKDLPGGGRSGHRRSGRRRRRGPRRRDPCRARGPRCSESGRGAARHARLVPQPGRSAPTTSSPPRSTTAWPPRPRWPPGCGPGRLDEVVGQDHLLGPGPPAAGPDRSRPAVVGHPVGSAGHGQDHAGPADRRGHQQGLRAHVGGDRRGQGRPRRGRRGPPAAGRAGPGHHLVPRRGPPLQPDPAGRPAARRSRTAPSTSSGPPPKTRSSRSTRPLLSRAPPCSGSSRSAPEALADADRAGPGHERRPRPTTTRSTCWSAWSTATPGPP